MLGNTDAVAHIAVKDLARARQFYEGTLGLTEVEAVEDEVVVYRSGNTMINVYRSQFAGTNQATAVGWPVGERMAEVVRALKDRGVVFEHYDLPGMARDGDIHGDADMNMQVAWFKDPDGNILSLFSA